MALNNIIVMNRGDTYEFDLTISTEDDLGARYKLQGNDAIYFGIMDPGQPFEIALVRKKFTVNDTDAEGNLSIVIHPEDTLDLYPGKYFYAIKLHQDHDEVNEETGEYTGVHINKVRTIINKTKLIICD